MSDGSTPRSMWEQRYSADTYIYGTEPNDFLRDSVATLPRGTALCRAEGEGRNAMFLAPSGFDVHSVDLTEGGVAKVVQVIALRPVRPSA